MRMVTAVLVVAGVAVGLIYACATVPDGSPSTISDSDWRQRIARADARRFDDSLGSDLMPSPGVVLMAVPIRGINRTPVDSLINVIGARIVVQGGDYPEFGLRQGVNYLSLEIRGNDTVSVMRPANNQTEYVLKYALTTDPRGYGSPRRILWIQGSTRLCNPCTNGCCESSN